MVSFLMIMKNELAGGPVETGLTDQHHALQTALFDTPHEAFGESIGMNRQLHSIRPVVPEW